MMLVVVNELAKSPTCARAVSRLVLAIFRAHGALLARGDALVMPLGLTSARWQVLGALALAGHALTVPAIARSMGLTRQAIQKQVDLLESEGLVAKQANDAHARSQLVVLTPAGRSAYARADRRWTAEAARLGKSASVLEWNAAAELVARIADQLESDVREGRSSS